MNERRTVLVCCLLAWTAIPRRGSCQPQDFMYRDRVEQILEAMDDNDDHHVHADELGEFLVEKADVLLKLTSGSFDEAGLALMSDRTQLERFLRRKARFIIRTLTSDTAKGVGQTRFKKLEEEIVGGPFAVKIQDLLPPPPDLLRLQREAQEKQKNLDAAVEAFFKRLQKWISIRKSFLDESGIGRPATLTVTHLGDEDDRRKADARSTNFVIRGAVAARFPEKDHVFGDYNLNWRPVIVYEADTNTAQENDKITHRAGFEGVLYRNKITDLLSGHNVKLTLDYLTDRDYRSDQYGGTFQYTPNFRRIGIGQYKALWSDYLSVRWRPYLGVNYANVTDPGSSQKLAEFSDYTNLFARVGAELRVSSRIKLTSEISWFHELQNERDGHVLFEVAGRVSLDSGDRVSLEFSYERGESAPEFEDRDSILFSFGVKL